MKKKYYNIDDEQYKRIIETLRQLPRIDAPPDFEMNLRRKLNNLKYQKEKKGFVYYFSLRKPFIPATAAAVCTVIAFLFLSKQSEIENPFVKIPPQRTNSSTQVQNNANSDKGGKKLLIDPGSISSNDVVIKKEAPKNPSRSSSVQHSGPRSGSNSEPDQMASNERASRSLKDLDFGGFGSDLDKSLRAKPDPNGSEEYGNRGANVNFGGFNLVPGPDRELDMLRSRMDSLKRMWLRENR